MVFFKVTGGVEPYVFYGRIQGDMNINEVRLALYQSYNRFVREQYRPGTFEYQPYFHYYDLLIHGDHKIEVISEGEYKSGNNPPKLGDYMDKLRFHKQQNPIQLIAKLIKSVRNKIFYEQNKDAITQRVTGNKYWDTHRDELNERLTCECGGRYTRRNKATHEKSKLHQKYLCETTIPRPSP